MFPINQTLTPFLTFPLRKPGRDLTLDDLAASKEVYLGMKVYWSANPGLINNTYRESIISQLFDERDIGTDYEHSFILNNLVVPGSSANALWAKINGKWKIIALIQGVYNGLGIAKSIDDWIPYLIPENEEY